MPSVRVERVPVQTLKLGVLGFDHLQLVYVASDGRTIPEDDWFVLEGLREVSASGLRLGVEGLHGATTLSEANGGATGDELRAKIGTADTRGSREIASGPEASHLWATLVAHASDIEAQQFPYIAYALPTSPLPTLNSSSLVSSLLYHAGLDTRQVRPHSLRLSPGTETLIGSSGDDVLSPVKGFTTVVAGDGADWLTGSFDASRIDKLYGGRGNDHFQWSKGLNIIHGGQPGLVYADDGRDTVHYAGVGRVTLRAGSSPAPHQSPDFIATFEGGEDRLFSIEEIVWDGESDRVHLDDGAALVETPIMFMPGDEQDGSRGDILDLSRTGTGLLIDGRAEGDTCVSPAATTDADICTIRVTGAEWIVGSPLEDHVHAGPAVRGIEGGGGDDLIDARDSTEAGRSGPRGFDLEIAGGAGDDTLLSGAGRNAVAGGRGADLFVLGSSTAELIIEDADPLDRISALGLTSARSETDGRTSNDLLIRVDRADGSDALIRVVGFRDGDLGLTSPAADRPLSLPDVSAAFDDGLGDDAASFGLEWWWDFPFPIDSALNSVLAPAGGAAHAAALVYDGDPIHPEGCPADDFNDCSW